MEDVYSSTHTKKYKFMFAAGDSQHVAKNVLNIFTHIE